MQSGPIEQSNESAEQIAGARAARQNPEDSDWDKVAAQNKKNGGITFTRHVEWRREPVILNQADVLHTVSAGRKSAVDKNTHKATMAFHLSPPRVW